MNPRPGAHGSNAHPTVSDRRRFLQSAAALAALGSATIASRGSAQSTTASTEVHTLRWRTAVGLNSFESAGRKYQKHFPLWEVLDAIARMGYDGIELVNGWPGGAAYPKASETERIRSLRRLYSAYGLQIFSIQTSGGDAFAPDATARKAWVEQFRDWALLAKQLGAVHLGIWPGGGLRGLTIDQAIVHCGDSFAEAGRIAQDLGLVAAFEIEPPFVFNKEEHIVRILERANHPALKTIYDPSHFDLMSGSTGRPHEMLRRIGVRNIGYVHLTDTDGTLRDGGTSKHLPVGDGHAHIAESLRVLREEGYRGWIMMDGWEIPDPYDAARKAKQAIDAAGE